MNKVNEMSLQLKALSDPTRLKLVSFLKRGEVCICDLVDVLQISQPAVSQQMKKLKDAGIILERKKGTWKHFRLNEEQPPYVQAIINELEAVSVSAQICCVQNDEKKEGLNHAKTVTQ
ncbi:ArsR family transcriptional regulator [Amphibacillus marinus]|uniref:ArsR family transcriptional regulator n=1 Tax=Amphibacillus marinus TaxID=872970 RepID=A0A1H8THX1_9BACI|nr:metalloregulator ArsR/SmtB family transcription factor [Amphibacillus marinus]SEO90118.1 ArsR family transcriptional regulator [Amphibacillus marinus]